MLGTQEGSFDQACGCIMLVEVLTVWLSVLMSVHGWPAIVCGAFSLAVSSCSEEQPSVALSGSSGTS